MERDKCKMKCVPESPKCGLSMYLDIFDGLVVSKIGRSTYFPIELTTL